jgi:DNA-binding CsgD family transcriptional regulator
LTGRQREVLDAVLRGMSNKEVAELFGCAEVTVENHLTAIYRKARVDGRNRLVARVNELGANDDV